MPPSQLAMLYDVFNDYDQGSQYKGSKNYKEEQG
jgi:hypothetical protein